MATRNTRLVIKNNQVPNAPFSGATVLKGEAIVNTADGIMMFSGITSSTSEWTPAGTGGNASFFEVGSNLYDLRLRNQITKYQGQTGSGLSGKFLSGTTSGFVLADISDIAASVDSYTTGVTWNPNVLTINLNNGKPSVPVTIDSFTALTVNGDLFVTGTETVNNLTITGTGLYNVVANGSNPNEIVNYSSLTAFSQTNDVYVTGSTLTPATDDSDQQTSTLLYHSTPIGGPYTIITDNTFTTGGTYSNITGDITFDKNDGSSFTVDLSSIDVNDTYVTGGTNTGATNNTNNASIGLLYNQDVAPGTYSLPYTDSFTTGGTWNSGTTSIDFSRNDGVTYSVNLSNIDNNDTFSTGGTVTQFATNNNNEQIVQITGNDGFTPFNITGLTDTFATGFTFTPNTLTISQNNGVDLTANIDSIDLSGVLSAVTFDINTTGNITATSFSGTSFSGGTYYGDGSNLTGINNYYVTGGTISYVGPDGTLILTRNDGNNVTITGITDVKTTGATLIGSTAYFDTNDALSAYTLDLSALDVNDTFVTGFTYNPSSNTFTISRNQGEPDLTAQISTVSGLTVTNLTQGRVVYVGTGGLLTDEAGFTYDQSTNTLGVENIEASGNVVIQGDLTVFGQAISAFTNELYVEDPNITLNYNPTGSTTVTSVGAGFTIQDGNGVSSGDVNFDIVRMQNLTGLTSTEIPNVSEYTGLTGYANRGWITQLNDIVIRSTDVTDGGSSGDITGVRVLAEFDVLDGGSY